MKNFPSVNETIKYIIFNLSGTLNRIENKVDQFNHTLDHLSNGIEQFENSITKKLDTFNNELENLKKSVKDMGKKIYQDKTSNVVVATELQQIKTLISEKKNEDVMSFEKLSSSHNISLPFKDEESFIAYDEKLMTNIKSTENDDLVNIDKFT